VRGMWVAVRAQLAHQKVSSAVPDQDAGDGVGEDYSEQPHEPEDCEVSSAHP
jgi:hypothetical protein